MPTAVSSPRVKTLESQVDWDAFNHGVTDQLAAQGRYGARLTGLVLRSRQTGAGVRARYGFAAADGRPLWSKLLTHQDEQTKFMKSQALTAGLVLAHHHVTFASGATLNACPWAGQCTAACVLDNGNGAYPAVQRARIWKTDLLATEPYAFGVLLTHELARFQRKAARLGSVGRLRMNTNADIRWHRVAPELFAAFPGIGFYDYSKNPALLTTIARRPPDNYRVVYSVNEHTNTAALEGFLSRGGICAVVTPRRKHAPVPASWLGHAVVDGDLTDDLWTYAPGTVVDLSAKGRARRLAPGGFVRSISQDA